MKKLYSILLVSKCCSKQLLGWVPYQVVNLSTCSISTHHRLHRTILLWLLYLWTVKIELKLKSKLHDLIDIEINKLFGQLKCHWRVAVIGCDVCSWCSAVQRCVAQSFFWDVLLCTPHVIVLSKYFWNGIQIKCQVPVFISVFKHFSNSKTLALYKSFTYLLSYLLSA